MKQTLITDLQEQVYALKDLCKMAELGYDMPLIPGSCIDKINDLVDKECYNAIMVVTETLNRIYSQDFKQYIENEKLLFDFQSRFESSLFIIDEKEAVDLHNIFPVELFEYLKERYGFNIEIKKDYVYLLPLEKEEK